MLKLVVQNARCYTGPLLFIIEDISSAAQKIALDVVMRARDYCFDEKMANWFFAATNQWEPADIPLQLLKEIMPPNTVSPKADRVAVWEPISRALERPKGKVVEADGALYVHLKAITPNIKSSYLATIDLKRKMFACDCPSYTGIDHGKQRGEEWRKRHLLCKHLLLSIFELNDKILEASPLSGEEKAQWNECKAKLQQKANTDRSVARPLAANYLYFFTKHVLPRLEMRPADYDESSLNRAKSALAF